jgi:hypothetical protein
VEGRNRSVLAGADCRGPRRICILIKSISCGMVGYELVRNEMNGR